jgi:3',5'-cyclic AMP phosphodiesterase CpdA
VLKFIVLSDLHLVPEGGRSLGLDVGRRLALGVAAINDRHADAAFCVLAGDLTDTGDKAAYEYLQRLIEPLAIPVCLTMGNHDHRPTFTEVFGTTHLGETGYCDRVIDAAGQRVIVLDSAETGQVAGFLQPVQLDWLRTQLDAAGGKPVIVVVHHHANPLRTVVDRIGLQNGDAFAACLKGYDVRQVLAGHVHYTSTALWHGIPFTTLAGGHYTVTTPLDMGDGPRARADRLIGPAQMGVVLSDADGTLVHFENYLEPHGIL